MAVLFCFACLFLLENELRNFFYPRLQVRLVMKGLCHARGALREEHCHLQVFLLKMACSFSTKKKFSGRIGTDLVIVKLSGTPGCLSWLSNISALRIIQ